MKIARCSKAGDIFWAVVDIEKEEVRPISGTFEEWAPRLTAGEGTKALRLAKLSLPLADVVLLPPIEKTNKVVVAGANYVNHLIEFGLKPPSQPIAFLKTYAALIGARDPILYPELTKELDHEVELVAVIGAEQIDRSNPLSGVLGYTVGNDVSARDLQRSGPPGIGMDLFAAKSQDKSTGLGPWIVTCDEFPPGSPKLHMQLRVNGDVRQDGSTADMTWDVGQLISFIDPRSRFECGDILFTGTPTGVGQATGRYLKIGDVVEASIEGIGTLRNVVMPRAA